MQYREEKKGLFSVPDDYYLVNYVSSDFKMKRGCINKYDEIFGTKDKLLKMHGNNTVNPDDEEYSNPELVGKCLLTDKILNLVVCEYYWEKQYLLALPTAIISLRDTCLEYGIKKVAIQKIHDNIHYYYWGKISALIKETFNDTDIEVLVCTY